MVKYVCYLKRLSKPICQKPISSLVACLNNFVKCSMRLSSKFTKLINQRNFIWHCLLEFVASIFVNPTVISMVISCESVWQVLFSDISNVWQLSKISMTNRDVWQGCFCQEQITASALRANEGRRANRMTAWWLLFIKISK